MAIHDSRHDYLRRAPRWRINWNRVMPYIFFTAGGIWLAFIMIMWMMES